MTETLNNTGETPNSGNTEEVVYPPFNPQNAAAEKQKRMEERAQHAADNGYKHAAIAFGNIAESYEQRAHEKEEEAGAAQEASQELSTTEDYKAQYPNAVEDIDKAHAMALAGDEDETKAASLRKRAQHAADNGYKHAAIAFGNIAESYARAAHAEEQAKVTAQEAGAAQEANQELSTTEDYKAQYPNAVEEDIIDKAHAMALAGDEDETKAASLRKRAQHAADNGYKHAAIAFGNVAESYEQRAHEKEEEAGATYDNMQNS